MKRNIGRTLLQGGAALLVAAAAVTGLRAAKDDFGLGRNMEIMVNMMRGLSLQCVDELSTDKFMKDGAAGMVRNLDPYTQYVSGDDMSKFEVLATGKYGGIGALIRMKRDSSGVVIAQPYKGSPSDMAGGGERGRRVRGGRGGGAPPQPRGGVSFTPIAPTQ